MAVRLDEQELSNLDKQTLIKMYLGLQDSVEKLSQSIDILTEEVINLRQHRFGRSSEKGLTEAEGYFQLGFMFNETEMTVDLNPDIPEPTFEEIHPKAYKRGKKVIGKRGEELKDLPISTVSHPVCEAQLQRAFPDGNYKQLPDEVYKRLAFHPASFEVIEHHVEVYVSTDGKTFVRGERPANLLRNSIVTPSLAAGIYNVKYVNAQPIQRLVKEFGRCDVFLPEPTMCRWVNVCSDRYLKRIYDRLREKLNDYHVLHADETLVEVRKDGRPAGSRSYMWVYRTGSLEAHPFVLYEYQKGRKADYPRQFLKDFSGICVTDGYEVYHSIARERNDLTIAGCWSHARRDFADVVKSAGKEKGSVQESICYKALQIIQTMFRYEQGYADMPPEERLEQRKRNVAPLVDAFFAYLKYEQGHVAPKMKTGRAISYCINQESFLRVFLTDGAVPMTNNAAEQSIRPFTLGRKNWYLIDTIGGAKSSAIAYSIAETAKANNLKPYEYFKYLLEELPKHGEFEEPSYLDELLPWSEKLPGCCQKKLKSES